MATTLRSAAARGLIALPLLAGIAAAQPALAAHRTAMHKTYTVRMAPGTGKMKYMYYFQPAKLTIKAGDTVRWIDVTPQVIHNIVGTNAAAKKLINRTAYNNKPYQVTFTKPGVYTYECQIHLPEMVGQIIVTK